MTVIRTADGKFEVHGGGERLAGPFDTHAQAWRWIDRHEGQPLNRSEATAEFIWNKMVHGTGGAA